MYAHVQIVRRITISRLWKLKIADCTRGGGEGARQGIAGGTGKVWVQLPSQRQVAWSRGRSRAAPAAHAPRARTLFGACYRWGLGCANFAMGRAVGMRASQRIGSTIPV